MSIQSTINQQLIYYNGYHVLFKLFWLQNSLENNPLLFKWSNVQNSLNNFSQDYWLGKLGGLISSAIGFYTKIILSIWRDFQWCCLSWRNWLEYMWLGFKINLGSWSICIMEFSVTVIFLGVLKFCEFSSLVMSLSTLFVVPLWLLLFFVLPNQIQPPQIRLILTLPMMKTHKISKLPEKSQWHWIPWYKYSNYPG